VLTDEEKKQNSPIASISSLPAALEKSEEKTLWDVVQNIRTQPQDSFTALNPLAQSIADFFSAALVTEEGFREARLGLLASVREIVTRTCGFLID